MSSRIAVTLGDPRGIGPEIVTKVLEDPPRGAEFVVIGPDEMVAAFSVRGVGIGSLVRERRPDSPLQPGDTSLPAVDPFFSSAPSETTIPTGVGLAAMDAGRLAALAVERAVSLALSGAVDAIVTGPAEKRALNLAGYRYPGHTEWLGHLAGDVETAMMLAANALRVVLVTGHISFSQILHELTTTKVVSTGRLAERELRERFGLAEPRLAVCAVNPHAGESGMFGHEDEKVLRPAAEALGATGPLPADTVFVRCMHGEFDAVLAPYHDVGMTAVKVAGFGRGVNVTLGLPFIRTAPDHGTAFDIAGTGTADASSMRAAVALAVRLAERRKGGMTT